jgi:hypothetical protein
MEALAALGLACNIIQVLNAANEAYSLSKRLLETGNAYPGLAENATAIKALSTSLQESLATISQPHTEAERQLLSLAKSCYTSAQELSCELDKLAGSAGIQGKLRESIKAGVKLRLRKGRLERLEKDMRACHTTLESGLLLRIWFVLTQALPCLSIRPADLICHQQHTGRRKRAPQSPRFPDVERDPPTVHHRILPRRDSSGRGRG